MSGLLKGRRPAAVAAAVLALYGAWIGAYLAKGGDVRDFIRIGTYFIAVGGNRSREIRLDPGYRPPANQSSGHTRNGYDGQFAYYIALDPRNARYFLDLPAYRYARVLQPMAVRALALGNRGAVPWLLLVVNWLAIGGGTWALAAWLRRRGLSPAGAALYALLPGTFVGLQRDLTEPLAYGLAIAAILVLDGRERWRLPAGAALFALAGLTRQTTLVFPLVYAVLLAVRGGIPGSAHADAAPSWRRGAALIAIAAGPYVAYSGFLLAWLGSTGLGPNTTRIPFGTLFAPPFGLWHQGIAFAFVVVPAAAAVVALAPRRSLANPLWLPWLALLANFLVNIVFYGDYQATTYTAASRLGIGTMISALLCLPYAGGAVRVRRVWLAAAAAVAMSPLPVVAVYGFTNARVPG
ncbi:MAG: hypothetical protein JOZ25_05680 [Actinobacteria bacterium]|nr:hypothetical protein [Actinomycetota bacterium]